MTDWHLAQMNVATMKGPKGDPVVQGFYDALDHVNAVAEKSPGFVWRMVGDGGDATDIQIADDPKFLINISVWESADALFDFVYKSAHTPVMAKRRDWIEPAQGAHQVLWWIRAGHKPTPDEGLARLWLLDRFGPKPQAFTFKTRFPAPQI